MAKRRADYSHVQLVEIFLGRFPELRHLRVLSRADLLTLVSGPEEDPVRHARFRRDTVHLWRLEMATHTGRWEKTPYRDQLEGLLELIVTTFPWTLAPIAEPQI